MKFVFSVLIALALATNLWAASGSDDLNRPDANPLDGSWTDLYNGGFYVAISSNHAESNSAGADIGRAYFTGFTAANDQEAWAEITIGGGADLTMAGIMVRASGTDLATDAIYYSCEGYAQNTYDNVTAWIFKYIVGAYTVLASENATGWGAADQLKCRVVGTTITFYRIGSLLLTATDGAISAGQPGIEVGGFTGNTADAQLDNFSATDYVASMLVRHRAVIQ